MFLDVQGNNDVLFCPMASKHVDRRDEWAPGHPCSPDWGAKFSAWKGLSPDGSPFRFGSYGMNGWLGSIPYVFRELRAYKRCWPTCNVKRAANVPVFCDCILCTISWYEPEPPPYDDALANGTAYDVCINRHDGAINSLFMDWPARKVGLKELWALKWHRQFDTAGPWTKAGGVKPEDWPEWMRYFKDY